MIFRGLRYISTVSWPFLLLSFSFAPFVCLFARFYFLLPLPREWNWWGSEDSLIYDVVLYCTVPYWYDVDGVRRGTREWGGCNWRGMVPIPYGTVLAECGVIHTLSEWAQYHDQYGTVVYSRSKLCMRICGWWARLRMMVMMNKFMLAYSPKAHTSRTFSSPCDT